MLRRYLFCKKTLSFKLIQRHISNLIQSKAFFDGSWVNSSNGGTFTVRNPANGQLITCIPDLTLSDVQEAICAAKNAFDSPTWTGFSAKQRASLLKNWYTLMEQNRNEIAGIITAETGKPITESLSEVAYGNSFIEWFAEEARRFNGEVYQSQTPNRETIILKEPIGVAALITPWNLPLAMGTRKIAAAIAAGCTVVIKPSRYAPLTSLAITKLAEEAGFPRGVINVVTTLKAGPIGDLFCKSPLIAGISYTGSTEIGKLLYKNCADTLKRITFELGGNAPFIVFDSANLEKAVEGAIASKFHNCGQACVATNRFYIHEKIYDKFLNLLKAQVRALKIGAGDKTDVQIGPLINKDQFKKMVELVKDAKAKKGDIITGGRIRKDIGELFYEPTIVTDISPSMMLFSGEIFGPIMSVLKFENEEEAVQMANSTRSGLAGYFYSENIQQIFRVARKLEVGIVGINEGIISTAETPFGGLKESGIVRDGSHQGVDEFTDYKYLCWGNLANFNTALSD